MISPIWEPKTRISCEVCGAPKYKWEPETAAMLRRYPSSDLNHCRTCGAKKRAARAKSDYGSAGASRPRDARTMATDANRNPPGASRHDGKGMEKATTALVFTIEEARMMKERLDEILGGTRAMTTFEKNILVTVRDKFRVFLAAKGYRARL